MELLHEVAEVGIFLQQVGILVAVHLILNEHVETLLQEGGELLLVEAHSLEAVDVLTELLSGDGHIGEGGHRLEFLNAFNGREVRFLALEELGGHVFQEGLHGLGTSGLFVVVLFFQFIDESPFAFVGTAVARDAVDERVA